MFESELVPTERERKFETHLDPKGIWSPDIWPRTIGTQLIDSSGQTVQRDQFIGIVCPGGQIMGEGGSNGFGTKFVAARFDTNIKGCFHFTPGFDIRHLIPNE